MPQYNIHIGCTQTSLTAWLSAEQATLCKRLCLSGTCGTGTGKNKEMRQKPRSSETSYELGIQHTSSLSVSRRTHCVRLEVKDCLVLIKS